VTTAAGAKFGKSDAGAAIYLDPALTSPYKFYQFWYNTDDRDVGQYLKMFTLFSRPDIEALLKAHAKDPSAREAQAKLATDVTARVHGAAAVHGATTVNAILFSDRDPRDVEPAAFDIMAQEIPTATVTTRDGISLVDAVVQVGLVKSKSEARRSIEQGGVYVNQQRVKEVDRKLEPGDWLAGRNVLLRKGKKDYALLRLSS